MPARRLPLLLALLAALVLVGDLTVVAQRSGAGSTPDRVGSGPTPSASATARRSASPKASPSPSREAGLAGLYAAPPWPRIADSIAETGPVDLAEAVKIDGDGAESERFLKQLGFRRAHIRAWGRVRANTYVTTLLYEFATAPGAKRFAEGVYLARAEDAQPAETLKPAGVRTLREAPDADGDVLRYAIVDRGVHVALVTMLTSNPAPADAIAVWRDVVLRQAARL